jgi:hypothetical protein
VQIAGRCTELYILFVPIYYKMWDSVNMVLVNITKCHCESCYGFINSNIYVVVYTYGVTVDCVTRVSAGDMVAGNQLIWRRVTW